VIIPVKNRLTSIIFSTAEEQIHLLCNCNKHSLSNSTWHLTLT